MRTSQHEVQRTVEPLGGNRYRVTETKTVTMRPELATALFGGAVPIGITSAAESTSKKPASVIVPSEPTRPHYETRKALMKDKRDGLITGHEWWFRPEYMRLSQNERRHAGKTHRKSTGARRTASR